MKLESHVSHLDNVSEEELNRLLSMVVDVENLFTCVHKEEDVDTKQVYFYLFRVRKLYFVTNYCQFLQRVLHRSCVLMIL